MEKSKEKKFTQSVRRNCKEEDEDLIEENRKNGEYMRNKKLMKSYMKILIKGEK